MLSRLLPMLLALSCSPAMAQDHVVFEEEWTATVSASRYVSPQHEAAEAAAIAAFGPFRVLDASTVALVDITDSQSPAQFGAMLRAFPQVSRLTFVEAPGTHDDIANLELGRMIRERGLVTSAPEGGSVRSGAVELFLAGVERYIDAGSEFAVHGWLDDRGMGAEDYPADAPEHRRYLDYYVEMGMGEEEARDFYDMTNSVPFESALWLTGEDMRGWIDGKSLDSEADAPLLTYASLSL